MSKADSDTPDDALMPAIMADLLACYGSLDEPNFRYVSEVMESGPFGPLIDRWRSQGMQVTDETEPNTDVSIQLILDRSQDRVFLGLSCVGPYAELLYRNAAEEAFFVTQAMDEPNSLAALVAQDVQDFGFTLVSRSLVSRRIKMNWYDDSESVTLYQALFTDTDWIP